MADKYGQMSAAQLEGAIYAAQQKHGIQHSSQPENQYLKSITAACKNLPHTNEASRDARRIYFSYLMAYGAARDISDDYTGRQKELPHYGIRQEGSQQNFRWSSN